MIRLPAAPKQLRAIGFDDGPHRRLRGSKVDLVGVVTSGTRFEGMVRGTIRKDGDTATQTLVDLLGHSKFASQVHLVLLDGIAFGGLNVVDLPALHEACGKPCIAVMRRLPDMTAMRRAIGRLPRPARRLDRIARAGPIHRASSLFFQVCGLDSATTAAALARITDRGHIPEPIRLAHHIAAAIADGQSRGRA